MFQRLPRIIRTFSRTEVVFLIAALILTVTSLVSLAAIIFNEKTAVSPVQGGRYREAVVGQPTFINPLLESGNEADGDLVAVIFETLGDLASKITPNKDGTEWNIRLKDNLVWHDGKPITADDIIFTVNTLQNPDIHSPLTAEVAGIETNRLSEREFILRIPQGYALFKNSIATLRPVPKHIFGNIPAANLTLSAYNLEPVGNGPFKLEKMDKRRDGFITEVSLIRNDAYAGKRPYLESLIIKFYSKEEEAILALNTGAVDGINGVGAANLPAVTISHETLAIRLPRLYAVFLNQYAKPLLQDKNIRLALNIATSRSDLIKTVFNGFALPAYGPLVPGIEGYEPSRILNETGDADKANAIMDAAGWIRGADGIREKTTVQTIAKNKTTETKTRLDFTLEIPDIPELVKIANLLKDQWNAVGIRLSLNRRSLADIEERILKTRNYDMVLMGQAPGTHPDLYPFWHSSQKFYPGLNLALYDNKTADIFIESIRKDVSENAQQNDLRSLQSVIENDLPAVFLYSPTHLYVARPVLRGFIVRDMETPSNRFDTVENWYVKTVRVFK